MSWMHVLLGAAQIAPVAAPPAVVAVPTTRVSIDVAATPLPVGVRYAYTVRYLSTVDDEPAIVRVDLGTSSAAGPGAFTSPPTDVRSPDGWRAVVTSDDTPDGARWRVAWSCGSEGWEARLRCQIRSGRTLAGFSVDVARADGTYASPRYATTFVPVR
ncbi:MAG: hypothetical protein ABW221_20440 [Vicinamibacteria bacterium]